VLSTFFIAPALVRTHWILVLAVVYGCFIFAQTIARRMVYESAKPAGFLLGTAAQGIALGFLLFVALATTGTAAEGLSIVGYAFALTALSTLAMLAYVTIERRDFSLLRAGLAMMFIPMLLLMGLQLVFPIGGMAGVVIAGVFVAVAVGSMLYKLNVVVHEMSTNMAVEAGYELTLGIVVLFWNILTFLMRMRRR
jgi:FtsH-binding integral membrane protein